MLSELLDSCSNLSECQVISFLFDHDKAVRNTVMKQTGRKRTTVHDTLVRLHVKEIIKRETVKQGRGRPTVYWSIKN